MKQLCALLVVLSFVSAVPSQTKAAPDRAKTSPAATKAAAALTPSLASSAAENRLPVKRVVLYKNGVGYFEHATRVRGSQDLNIDFTTAQLNDVLKSLTVVDMGEGRISSVRYNSIAPLGERLKGLRLPFGEQVSRDDFLTALRGARVEVRSGATSASGKLLSVDKTKRQTAKGDIVETTEIAIVSDAGEVRNFELGLGTSVRLAERDLNDEVGRYLNLIGSSRARDLRRMTITATGNGERDVFVSYISEVPVWKSTYRIILPQKGRPMLQGWAIVDNTIGEDWKDVHLSLVAGAPQSFVQEISQPQYARRPVVALPESLQLTPQSHEATLEQFDRLAAYAKLSAPRAATVLTSLEGVVTDAAGASVPNAHVTVRNEETGVAQTTTTDQQGRYRFRDVQAGNSAVSVAARGLKRFELANLYLGVSRNNEVNARLDVGAATETIMVTAAAPSVMATESAELSAVVEKQTIEAEGKAAGDFFEYDIKQGITIGKNQSALVPILQAPVEVEKVTLVNMDSAPLRALWIKNTSGQILDSGTFNILDGETFAGEGVFEVLHPDERRLLSYSGDPAIHTKVEEKSDEKPYTEVRIAKGVMRLIREQHGSKKYMIRNADSSARVVVVEHPVHEGWKLAAGGPKPEESTTNFYRFRMEVAPTSTAELMAEEMKPEDTVFQLNELEDDEVRLLVDQSRVTPAMRQAFDRILAQKEKIDGFEEQVKERDQEVTQITTDQTRLRENMKALKGSAEEKVLLQRYTRQLNDQEDRLATLRKETADLQSQRIQANAELEKMVMAIDLDEKF